MTCHLHQTAGQPGPIRGNGPGGLCRPVPQEAHVARLPVRSSRSVSESARTAAGQPPATCQVKVPWSGWTREAPARGPDWTLAPIRALRSHAVHAVKAADVIFACEQCQACRGSQCRPCDALHCPASLLIQLPRLFPPGDTDRAKGPPYEGLGALLLTAYFTRQTKDHHRCD